MKDKLELVKGKVIMIEKHLLGTPIHYCIEKKSRRIVVSPPGSNGTTILLARASKQEQVPFIGNQAGGRIFLFLGTDDFWRDYNEMIIGGIEFVREPKEQDYGTVAVFKDL